MNVAQHSLDPLRLDQQIAIRARGLSREFGSRLVLRGIDLDVVAGQCVALTGANGAGKTTLLRCLASVARPTAGEIHWFGRPARGEPADRRLVGMVAHESRLYPNLSLRENLIFAGRMCGLQTPVGRADQLLAEVHLASRADSLPTQVSKGMRQRVAVARSIVHEPRIVLLDEPFAGLDTLGREWLSELLIAMREQGRTICFATHDEAKAWQLADRVFELRSGRLHELPAVLKTGLATAPLRARAA